MGHLLCKLRFKKILNCSYRVWWPIQNPQEDDFSGENNDDDDSIRDQHKFDLTTGPATTQNGDDQQEEAQTHEEVAQAPDQGADVEGREVNGTKVVGLELSFECIQYTLVVRFQHRLSHETHDSQGKEYKTKYLERYGNGV